MKSKFKKAFLIIIILLVMGCGLLVTYFEAQADYKIEVTLPGGPAKGTPVSLVDYMRAIYLFGLGLVGVAALGALVYGGFTYMLSETITTKEEAKKWIWGALSGLILGLAAYLILYTINPALVSLEPPSLPGLPALPGPSPPVSCASDNDCDTNNCEFCNQNTCKSKCHSECQRCENGACVNEPTGTSCKQGQRVCKNGQCINCETEGGWCTIDICCPGLICKPRAALPDICAVPPTP